MNLSIVINKHIIPENVLETSNSVRVCGKRLLGHLDWVQEWKLQDCGEQPGRILFLKICLWGVYVPCLHFYIYTLFIPGTHRDPKMRSYPLEWVTGRCHCLIFCHHFSMLVSNFPKPRELLIHGLSYRLAYTEQFP